MKFLFAYRPYSQWLASLLMLLLLAGCHNTDPTTGTTTISGQVVAEASRQPVAGATVQVFRASSGGGYVTLGTGYPADAQGRFAFSFEATQKTGYILLASAPPGYTTPFYAGPNLTAGRSNDNLTIPMLVPAWVKLQLVDEPPKSRVSMYLSGYEGNGDRLNYPRDTVLIRPCVAGLTKTIIWVITDAKGIDTQYSRGITLGALDTVAVRIPF